MSTDDKGTPTGKPDVGKTHYAGKHTTIGGKYMPHNQNLTDKEISTALLNAHKLGAQALTTLIIESTDQSIRQDAMQVLNSTLGHQKQIFDYMNSKGYYTVEAAPGQEVQKAQQQLQQQQQQ